jgi:hypothetical protein
MNDEKCIAAKREPAASEVLNNLGRLADMAEKVSGRVAEQLHPVLMEDRPSPEKDCGSPDREYPPLFNEMRDRMITIEFALLRMNKILDRCEI